jgi:hypothetical protein
MKGGDKMEVIEVKADERKEIDDASESIDATKAGLAALSSQLKYEQKRFWALIHDLYPQSKGMHGSYKHKTGILILWEK